MKKITCILLITGLMISCSNKSNELKFSRFELTDETGEVGISVEEDGTFFIDGGLTGKVDRKGFIRDTSNNVLLEVRNDSVFKASEKYLYRVSKSGTIDDGSGFLQQWSKEGELLFGETKNGTRITPADKNSFQTASILWRYYTNYLL